MYDVGSAFHTDGSIVYSNGTRVSPAGATFLNNGAVLHPDLKIIWTDGTEAQGQLYDTDATNVKDDKAGTSDAGLVKIGDKADNQRIKK